MCIFYVRILYTVDTCARKFIYPMYVWVFVWVYELYIYRRQVDCLRAALLSKNPTRIYAPLQPFPDFLAAFWVPLPTLLDPRELFPRISICLVEEEEKRERQSRSHYSSSNLWNETIISLVIDLVYINQILMIAWLFFLLKPSYFKKLVPCIENMGQVSWEL